MATETPQKKLKRYGDFPDGPFGPDGRYTSGVTIPAIQVRLGIIMGIWTLLEERMIEVLEAWR